MAFPSHRFRNTLTDLQDCQRHMDDETFSSEEEAARTELIKLCNQIALDYSPDYGDGDE